MKTRTSFVSNSSSSSFIVLKSDISKENEKFLKKRIKKYSLNLDKLVFPIDKNKRIRIGKSSFILKKKSIEEQIFTDQSFGLKNKVRIDVHCNEDEVIYDLFAKKIPFIATIHYEHFLLFFDGEKLF